MPTKPGQTFAGKRNNLPVQGEEVLVPATIAEDSERLAVWRFLSEDLINRGMYSPTYTLLLEQFTVTVCLLRRFTTEAQGQSSVIERFNKQGDVIGTMENPIYNLYLKTQRAFLTFIEKFGMSPKDIVFLQGDGPTSEEIINLGTGEQDGKVIYFR